MRELFDGVVPFVTVADAGSFTAAAQRLGVTPAAVSKAVARLEARLEVRLFHRSTRQVELSEEGALYLRHCREAMREVHAGRDRLALYQEVVRGSLKVSTSPVLQPAVLVALERLQRDYPELTVELELTDRLSDLIDERVDVALRIGELQDSSMIARRLAVTQWVTVASPVYLGQHGQPSKPTDLARHRAIVFRSPHNQLVAWRFAGIEEPVRLEPALVVDQGLLMVEAARAGLGIAQVFRHLVVRDLHEGDLVEVLHEWALDGPQVHALCRPGQAQVLRVRVMLDALIAAFDHGVGRPSSARDS